MKNFSTILKITAIGALITIGLAGCATNPHTSGTYPAALIVLNRPADLQYVAVFPNDTAFTPAAIAKAAVKRPYYPNYDAGEGDSISASTKLISLVSEGKKATVENEFYVVIAVTNTTTLSGRIQKDVQFTDGLGTVDYNDMTDLGGPSNKVIVIQDMPAAVYGYFQSGGVIQIIHAGTNQGAAAAYSKNPDIVIDGRGPYTVTIPLRNWGKGTRWTGSGAFDVYFESDDGAHKYKVGSVTVSSDTTSVSFNNAVEIRP